MLCQSDDSSLGLTSCSRRRPKAILRRSSQASQRPETTLLLSISFFCTGISRKPIELSTNTKRSVFHSFYDIFCFIISKKAFPAKKAEVESASEIKILMGAGHIHRVAAKDQSESWADRIGCEIIICLKRQCQRLMRHCFVVVVTTAVLGYLALVSICWENLDCRRYVWHTGLSVGLIYGFFYVTRKYGFNILNHTGLLAMA
ncbi:unnamed protein product [Citrullus colocynthis]|uniref:Uncharacterized protein n=1 Tax=Citrullus colocynthis TaxID=252529 RepID=A0ABP0YJX9_9ROSI